MNQYFSSNYPSVKNIIFDLGNVILDVDYMATVEAFKLLGVHDFDRIFTQYAQHPFLDEWDKGYLTPAAFRQTLRKIAPVLEQVNDMMIDRAWNAMLGELPLVRLQLLQALRPQYRTFLLSNTNEIHVTQFAGIVHAVSGAKDLSTYFEKTYYSNQIGMRKPDPEIYEWTLSQNGLKASETLFIDDLLSNIEGAEKVGLQTLHLKKGEMFLEKL